MRAGLSKENQYDLPVNQSCIGCYVTHDPPLPSFIKFEYPIYKFKVVEKRDCCKLHVIKGKLQNDMGFVPFSFQVNVKNNSPYFSKNELEN